ncbi:AraC family transcriptional regulator Rsp [Staphylococcus warneri]|uniref:AraC family transcriptional regulator Rsp n=4 Tax=Staphylococcus warneri TaxID=1292 RepID=UPI00066C1D11|nr:AraC family transcriptional regulator Rsp [Staphylococcus warneri]AXZ22666.1 AraC family transcriptional regulator [Staphylococcus warneri]KTW08685.1 AraC family transcriptional regulator [Staphylococcus warneri]OIS42902.1 AraC family transcriptional regulator [Staphylococcus warneri]OIS44123.1 AraC family transcriptional regulator [Staphylococcus warneri]PTI08095.1 AraC family transcriptional regulator [Staphylococcus warneri]
MSCHLTLSTQHQTQPCRNINQIIILFSLSHELSIKINGERKDLDAHIAIINHGDIYEIENATHLVQLSIPIFYFYIEDTSFFQCYFDRHLLQSSDYIKTLLLQLLQQDSKNNIDQQVCPKIIQTLYKEAVVKLEDDYIPNMAVNYPLFANCLQFLEEHLSQPISLKDVATHSSISESYCSNLFNRYLNMNFKDYFTSLKLCHSIQLLMTSHLSINAISEISGFTSHTNFTNQFKNYLQFSPKQYRTYINQIDTMPQLNIGDYDHAAFLPLIENFNFNDQLTTEITKIDIEHFDPKDHSKASKAFIRLDNFNELFHFTFNDYFDIDFSFLPEPVILINDIKDLTTNQINYHLLYRCFDKLFERHIGLAMTIKSKVDFKAVNQFILTFLQGHTDYQLNKKTVKLMLIFDSATMTIHDIHLCHLKIKNKNRDIKYGVTIDGLLHQHQTLDKTYDILRRLHFDYYLLDIENIETTSLLINKSKTYNRTTSHFDNYKQFIIDSGIESTRFVYDYLSLKCFKYTNNGVNPLQLADLVCHIIALLRYGGGISYQLIATGSIYISLFNEFGNALPLIHIYKMAHAFVDEPIQISNNYIMSRKDGNYHFILFNKINDRYLSDTHLEFILKNNLKANSLITVQTLNNEHGTIDNLLPQNRQQLFLDKEMIEQLDRSNHPKTELSLLELDNQDIKIILKHDEVKYICIKPN